MIRVPHAVLFCFVIKVSREGYTNFSAFSHLSPLPQVFRQVMECIKLQLQEVIRLLHEVACSVVFLFNDRDWQGGMLKLMKNDHFLVFLAVWIPFPKVLSRLRSGLCQSCIKLQESHMKFRSQLLFFIFEWSWQRGVFKVMKDDHLLVLLAVWVFFLKILGRLMSSLY